MMMMIVMEMMLVMMIVMIIVMVMMIMIVIDITRDNDTTYQVTSKLLRFSPVVEEESQA